MYGFQGVKLPPFFGLRKFFGKYLFKMVKIGIKRAGIPWKQDAGSFIF